MVSVAAAAGEEEEEGAGQGGDARCETLTQLVCCIYTERGGKDRGDANDRDVEVPTRCSLVVIEAAACDHAASRDSRGILYYTYRGIMPFSLMFRAHSCSHLIDAGIWFRNDASVVHAIGYDPDSSLLPIEPCTPHNALSLTVIERCSHLMDNMLGALCPQSCLSSSPPPLRVPTRQAGVVRPSM